MDNLDEIWAFDEPHPSGGNCQVTMTKLQAIEWTKRVYAVNPKYKDATDEQLFNEFVAVHWAYKYEEKTK